MCDACFDKRTMDANALRDMGGWYLPDEFMSQDLWDLPIYTK